MNLNKLKPAWRIVKLENQFSKVEKEQILTLIAPTQGYVKYNTSRVVANILLFLLLSVSCQGG